MKKSLILKLLCCGALLVGFSTGAFAQATRTWVSGVGDDANPCSRTAPCKTFAGAISKTATNGEINVLDPGGFGGVTITKPITISSESFEAGVLVSGTNAIVVNTPNASDVVVLRGLDIEGLTTGLSGITVLTGGTVQVERCTINHFTVSGINFVPTVTNAKLNVLDTIIRNNGNFGASTGQGTLVNPTNAVTAHFNNVRWENNVAGLKVQGNSKSSVSNCLAGDNAFAGFSAATSPAVLNIENSVSTHNGTGVNGAPGTNVRLGNNSITDNGAAVGGGGTIFSFKNNDFDVAAAVTPINPQ
jgi:Right handed beta helix region